MQQPSDPPALQQPSDYQSLCRRLGLHDGIPHDKRWSAAADFLTLIVDHCLRERPGTIVECSSGLTTLMLARCCQMHGHGHVYSLENGARFAQATREVLAHYGLQRIATVIHAPLVTTRLEDGWFQWYAIDRLPRRPMDMLVVDGPPGFLQRHSRYPALPMLGGRMARRCSVYLDDAGRTDERELVGRWQTRYPRARHEFVDTRRGCSILRFTDTPPMAAQSTGER